ncbi:MAG: hypothetical protein Q8910_00150 [Bacteroidota bacterium]|nr:hypothetical protein [Bacteroidota bacterium]
MTVQDHLIIELLDELDEAKKIFRDMQKLKDNRNLGIFNFQAMNRVNEAAEFLEKYDKG